MLTAAVASNRVHWGGRRDVRKTLSPPALTQMSSWTLVGSFSVRSGVTTACLCDDGSRPSRREVLTIAVRFGSSTSTISFSRNVGMGSSAQDLVGDCMISRRLPPRCTVTVPTATHQPGLIVTIVMMMKWLWAVGNPQLTHEQLWPCPRRNARHHQRHCTSVWWRQLFARLSATTLSTTSRASSVNRRQCWYALTSIKGYNQVKCTTGLVCRWCHLLL